MNQIDWKRKLSSRKLWAAMAGIVTGLASVVSYIITEGKVDAAGVKKTAEERADCPAGAK